MVHVIACPDREELQRLLLGQVPESDAEQMERHLAGCPKCVETLNNLKVYDTLYDALRRASAPSDEPPQALIEGLIDRVRKLPNAPDGSPATSARASALTPAPSASNQATPQPDAAPNETKEVCNLLAPAQGPDELGRLGSYRILKILGAGGMGVVFQAEDTLLKRPAAIKVMKPSYAMSPTARQRFLREAQATAVLKHDHIVTVYQVGEERGIPYLVMEFLQGHALDTLLRRCGRYPIADVLTLGRQIAEGLAAAHAQGLMHRDIKPANIWLETPAKKSAQDAAALAQPAPARVKLLDFGLARAIDDVTHLTQSGYIVGTPAFMAPEQATGQSVDHRCDLFSLGCVLYRMATGLDPFTGENTIALLMAVATAQPKPPQAINPEVPRALSELIQRLLSKHPDGRPASAQVVVEALSQIDTHPTSGHQPALGENRGIRLQNRRELETDHTPRVLAPALAGLDVIPTQPARPSLPRPAPQRSPVNRIRTLIAIGIGLLGASVIAAVMVFRISSPTGTVVIETEDPDIEIAILQGGSLEAVS